MQLFTNIIFAICVTMLVLACSALGGSIVIDKAAHNGGANVMKRVIGELTIAYDQGRYDDVVRIYEAPNHIVLSRDVSLKDTLRDPLSVSEKIIIADAYYRTGNSNAAESLYLDVIGWSADQYRAYCALSDDCGNITKLSSLAQSVK